jgi:hypothetical protein
MVQGVTTQAVAGLPFCCRAENTPLRRTPPVSRLVYQTTTAANHVIRQPKHFDSLSSLP